MSTKTIVMFGSFVVVLAVAGWGEARGDSTRTLSAWTDGAAEAAAPEVDRVPPGSTTPTAATPALKCVQVSSSGFTACKDAGGVDSTCATAKCGSGYTLTGGGGTCASGSKTIKGLNPKQSAGEFGIMCEEQGTAPQAKALCCKL